MEVKRKDLMDALQKVGKFTGNKGCFPIVQNVLVTGNSIIATDLMSAAKVTLDAKNFTREMDVPKEKVIWPEDSLIDELADLKVAQLKGLCLDYGISLEKSMKLKDQIMEAIVKVSDISADEEENREPRKIEVAEQFCVAPKKLLEIVRSLDEDEFTIAVSEFKVISVSLFESVVAPVEISIGKNFMKLPVLDPAEFPEIPEFKPGAKLFKETGENLVRALSAMGKDSEPAAYKSSLVIDGAHDALLTCDGGRINMLTTKIKGKNTLMIPGNAVRKIAGIAKKESIVVYDGERVLLKYEDLMVACTPNTEEIPPIWETFKPEETDRSVSVKHDDLKSAIKQATLMLDDEFKAAVLTFNGAINVEFESGAGKYARDSLEIIGEAIDPEIKVGLNVAFIRDAIANLDKESDVKIRLTAPDDDGDDAGVVNKPVYFEDGKGFNALVMPMRV